jgi:hypothetical protein
VQKKEEDEEAVILTGETVLDVSGRADEEEEEVDAAVGTDAAQFYLGLRHAF